MLNNEWNFERAAANLNVKIAPFDLEVVKNLMHPANKALLGDITDESQVMIGGYHTNPPDGTLVVAINPKIVNPYKLHAEIHELAHVVMRHTTFWMQLDQDLFVEGEIAAESVTQIHFKEHLASSNIDDVMLELERTKKAIDYWTKVKDLRPYNQLRSVHTSMMLDKKFIRDSAQKIFNAGALNLKLEEK